MKNEFLIIIIIIKEFNLISNQRKSTTPIQIQVMTNECTDIGKMVFDHGGTLEGETPRDDGDVWGQAHGEEHLWSEHAAVADLDPLV